MSTCKLCDKEDVTRIGWDIYCEDHIGEKLRLCPECKRTTRRWEEGYFGEERKHCLRCYLRFLRNGELHQLLSCKESELFPGAIVASFS